MVVKEFIEQTQRDKKNHPPFQHTTLGSSNNGFAGISSFFSEYKSVVDYETGSLDKARLRALYPRFGRSPIIQELEKQARAITGAKYVVVLPNEATAKACSEFVTKSFPETSWTRNIRDYPGQSLQILCFESETHYKKAMEFWQHAGEIVTARHVLPLLDCDLPKGFKTREYSQAERSFLQQKLTNIIRGIYKLSADKGIFIENTGMAAIFHAFQSLASLPQNQNEGVYVQFGFPYTDTFKILEKWGGKAELLSGFNHENYDRIEALAADGTLKGVFTEATCNPLISTPDLNRLSTILRRYKVPLVVDDTLGTPMNIEVLPYADIVVDSLTKFISGKANVMGGAMIINQASPLANALNQSALATYTNSIAGADLDILIGNSLGFRNRMARINENARIIAKFLRSHPGVEWVGYPEGDATERNYTNIKTRQGGYGGMISLRLRNEDHVPEFMHNLHCWKGPSLGWERMIASLYTLFAHFTELQWAEKHGVGKNDIRLSVGIDKEEITYLDRALRVA